VETRFFSFLRDHWGEREEYEVDLSKRDVVAAAIDALPETLSACCSGFATRAPSHGKAPAQAPEGFWKEWGAL